MILKSKIIFIIIFFFICCHNSRIIEIPITQEPIIKIEEGKTVAIIPFSGDDYDIDAINKAVSEIEEAIEYNTDLIVIDKDEVEKEMTSVELKLITPGTERYIATLGKLLRCDYVLYGNLDFFFERYSEQGYAPNERYTADKPYAPELIFGPRYSMENYDIELRYTLRLTIMGFNVNKSKIIFNEKFEKVRNEIYKPYQLPIDLHKLYQIYSSLLFDISDQFSEKLSPHNIRGKRYFLE
ncbi:MAG: hypothetical protein ACUVWP_00650 [bacterium]